MIRTLHRPSIPMPFSGFRSQAPRILARAATVYRHDAYILITPLLLMYHELLMAEPYLQAGH